MKRLSPMSAFAWICYPMVCISYKADEWERHLLYVQYRAWNDALSRTFKKYTTRYGLENKLQFHLDKKSE